MVKTTIVVTPYFESIWPYTADHLKAQLIPFADVTLKRVEHTDVVVASEVLPKPDAVERLIVLGARLHVDDADRLNSVREVFVSTGYEHQNLEQQLQGLDIKQLVHPSVGYWAQSVAEFALALTICGLRRIPQLHHAILSEHSAWDHPLEQFGDDPAFANGTVEGKRVRIVGAGNIASRYAGFASALGADVASWDPFASEPSFHRSGARREWHLDRLVSDAEIFAPMVPLTPSTAGLITADHIDALPAGTLVVLTTRAGICDMAALRRRILADELSLAADVFDVEPLPLNDPILGRSNVVHTPHQAGRTKDANLRWAEALVEQFEEWNTYTSPTPGGQEPAPAPRVSTKRTGAGFSPSFDPETSLR